MAFDDKDLDQLAKLIDIALERRLAPLVADVATLKADMAAMRAEMVTFQTRLIDLQQWVGRLYEVHTENGALLYEISDNMKALYKRDLVQDDRLTRLESWMRSRPPTANP